MLTHTIGYGKDTTEPAVLNCFMSTSCQRPRWNHCFLLIFYSPWLVFFLIWLYTRIIGMLWWKDSKERPPLPPIHWSPSGFLTVVWSLPLSGCRTCDMLLTNRIWARWWAVTSTITLLRLYPLLLADSLFGWLWEGKLSCWTDLSKKELRVASNQWPAKNPDP